MLIVTNWCLNVQLPLDKTQHCSAPVIFDHTWQLFSAKKKKALKTQGILPGQHQMARYFHVGGQKRSSK